MMREIEEPYAHTQNVVEHALENGGEHVPSRMYPKNMDIASNDLLGRCSS